MQSPPFNAYSSLVNLYGEIHISRKAEPETIAGKMGDSLSFQQILAKELFEGPCKCCGQHGHGVFSSRSDLDTIRIHLSCPSIEEEDWEQALKTGLNKIRFKPDKTRFAKMILPKQTEAFRAFQSNGYGRLMDYMSLVDFDNDVMREISRLRTETEQQRTERHLG